MKPADVDALLTGRINGSEGIKAARNRAKSLKTTLTSLRDVADQFKDVLSADELEAFDKTCGVLKVVIEGQEKHARIAEESEREAQKKEDAELAAIAAKRWPTEEDLRHEVEQLIEFCDRGVEDWLRARDPKAESGRLRWDWRVDAPQRGDLSRCLRDVAGGWKKVAELRRTAAIYVRALQQTDPAKPGLFSMPLYVAWRMSVAADRASDPTQDAAPPPKRPPRTRI